MQLDHLQCLVLLNSVLQGVPVRQCCFLTTYSESFTSLFGPSRQKIYLILLKIFSLTLKYSIVLFLNHFLLYSAFISTK